MRAKLLLQILLTVGCVAAAVGVVEATLGRGGMGRPWLFTPVGWWRGAIACWVLVVAIRMVYPAQPK